MRSRSDSVKYYVHFLVPRENLMSEIKNARQVISLHC